MRPAAQAESGRWRGASREATCPRAWTPASVLPAPVTRTGEPQSFSIASCRTPCTLGPFGCTCQPTNGAPSYSSVSFKDMAPGARYFASSSTIFFAEAGRTVRASCTCDAA